MVFYLRSDKSQELNPNENFSARLLKIKKKIYESTIKEPLDKIVLVLT
jgi:uncharacterized radical SAM superfamily Fe-S cluster-containing enzyme